MDLSTLFNFEIYENYVTLGTVNTYFYRFFPPNLSIFTDFEKENEINNLCDFYDSIFMPYQIFAMDKVEDLSKNKTFFQGMQPQYYKYTSQIVEQISSLETDTENTNSIQRAYYFIIQPDANERMIFEESLRAHNFKFYLVTDQELVTIMRNFILREFLPFDLYTFEMEETIKYEQKYTKKKKANKGSISALQPDNTPNTSTVVLSAPPYHTERLSSTDNTNQKFPIQH